MQATSPSHLPSPPPPFCPSYHRVGRWVQRALWNGPLGRVSASYSGQLPTGVGQKNMSEDMSEDPPLGDTAIYFPTGQGGLPCPGVTPHLVRSARKATSILLSQTARLPLLRPQKLGVRWAKADSKSGGSYLEALKDQFLPSILGNATGRYRVQGKSSFPASQLKEVASYKPEMRER